MKKVSRRFDPDPDFKKVKKEFKTKDKKPISRFCKHQNRYISSDEDECEECIAEILNNE